MKTIEACLAAFLLGAACAGSGIAVADELRREALFWELDMDENGLLSRAEAVVSEPLRRQWADLDRNRDNLIDPHEFEAFETLSPFGDNEQLAGR